MSLSDSHDGTFVNLDYLTDALVAEALSSFDLMGLLAFEDKRKTAFVRTS